MSKPLTGVQANFIYAKVLIVEDNDDQWLLIQQAMQTWLSEVTPLRVTCVEEAMRLLAEWQHQEWELPKLILLDLYLPDRTDGWHLLKAIKSMSDAISLVPIVMFSSSRNAVDIAEAYRLGVSAYVVKPTQFTDWQTLFGELRAFWWETTTLPPLSYGL